jgi:glycogen operon protein
MRKNFIATLLFSQGVRMLLGGDEMGRTQHGNNNAYCQDNELSWVCWDLSEDDQDLLDFTRRAIRIFQDHAVLRRRAFFTGGPVAGDGVKDVTWLSPDGTEMTDEDWGDPNRFCMGMLIDGQATDETDERGRLAKGDTVLVVLNGGEKSMQFSWPEMDRRGAWEVLVDTAREDQEGTLRQHPGLVAAGHSLSVSRLVGDREAKG